MITEDQLNAFANLLNNALGTSKSAGECVNWLQSKLGITVNGIYDAATQTAVANYQTANSLPSTGLVDDATLTLLLAA